VAIAVTLTLVWCVAIALHLPGVAAESGVLDYLHTRRSCMCVAAEVLPFTFITVLLHLCLLWSAAWRAALAAPCVTRGIVKVQSATRQRWPRYFRLFHEHPHFLVQWLRPFAAWWSLPCDAPLYLHVLTSAAVVWQLQRLNITVGKEARLAAFLLYWNSGGIFIGLACAALGYWHTRLVIDAATRVIEEAFSLQRRAPPGSFERLPRVVYDPAEFGDGRRYGAECAICLGQWEESDAIKAMPCGHAFHEDCLGPWMQTARTCALCRTDLEAPPAAPQAMRPAVPAVDAGLRPVAPSADAEAPDEAVPVDAGAGEDVAWGAGLGAQEVRV